MSVQRFVRGVGGALILALAASSWVQAQPAGPKRVDPQAMARYQIAVMEGILETYVQRGARTVAREWRAIAPDMMMLSGAARARGFRLPGYGLFFDVEVPALSQSVFWSWSVLNRDTAVVSDALQSMRELINKVNDPAARREFEANLKRIESQVGPLPKSSDTSESVLVDPRPAQSGKAVSNPAAAPKPGTAGRTRSDVDTISPNDAYTTEVKNSLIDAMIEYSNALPIEADEWLTVAARDSGDRRVEASDPYRVRDHPDPHQGERPPRVAYRKDHS